MGVETAIELEPATVEPRVLHAVVEDKLQRSGRMELRRRLLKAIVERRDAVSWELREGRLRSPSYYPGADLVFPSSDEDSQETRKRARILFDLWTNEIRYLARLSPTALHGSGTFYFGIEAHIIPVRVTGENTGDAKRVELELDETAPLVQQAAKRSIQWHEQYRLGHCPVSPFAEPDPPSQPSNRRKAFWGFLPAILVTVFSMLATAAALMTFTWPIVLGSVLWGLVVVPAAGWFALNWLANTGNDSPEGSGASTNDESIQRTWTLGCFVFGAMFVSLLLMPAIVAGIWLREPEAVNLAMATIFGFMIFLLDATLFHHVCREPDIEPL
jgi:hypothetical protein